MLLPNNTRALYKKLYPNLTREEIEQEVIAFNEYVLKEKRIDPSSANWTKLQRGWLMKANQVRDKSDG